MTKMNRFTKQLLQLAAGMVAIAFLNGCALTTAEINYTSQKNVASVAGADRSSVKLEVVDARLIRDRIGQVQYDANDVAPAPVTAADDPMAVLKQAVANELVNRGFKLSDNGTPLVVQLETLYGVFTVKRQWPEIRDATATAEISVRITKSDGSLVYHTTVTGEAEKRKPGSRAQGTIVISEALEACLAHLFADPSFVNALLSGSTS
jgi:uncharacterized lipoprotein YajG